MTKAQEPDQKKRNVRKVYQGKVSSDKRDKTITVVACRSL